MLLTLKAGTNTSRAFAPFVTPYKSVPGCAMAPDAIVPDPDAAMFTAAQAPFTCTAAALMALQPIVVSLSKNSRGVFDYSIPMSNMLAELLKLGISTTLLVIQRVKSARGGRADDALLSIRSCVQAIAKDRKDLAAARADLERVLWVQNVLFIIV